MSEAANPLLTRFQPPIRLKPSTAETAARPWIAEARRQVQVRSHFLRHRVNTYRKERPVTVLFVLAGVAFTAGIMLRVWRSAND